MLTASICRLFLKLRLISLFSCRFSVFNRSQNYDILTIKLAARRDDVLWRKTL